MSLTNADKINWTGRMLTLLAVLPFIPSAFMKLTMNPKVIEGMAHFGFPATLIMTLGILEVLCVVLYLIPVTSILGAILLTGYLGGAICTHLRVGEVVYMQTAIGVLVWAGLYLREPRLRSLIPLKK